MKTSAQIKTALVAAHRNEDWEAAKKLSQEKQRMKKNRYCQHPGCGVRIASRNDYPRTHCRMHYVAHRFYGSALACAVFLFALPAFAAPVTLDWDYDPAEKTPDMVFKLYSTESITAPTWTLFAETTNQTHSFNATGPQKFFVVTAFNYLGESGPSNITNRTPFDPDKLRIRKP